MIMRLVELSISNQALSTLFIGTRLGFAAIVFSCCGAGRQNARRRSLVNSCIRRVYSKAKDHSSPVQIDRSQGGG